MRLDGIDHITAITADESLESLGERLSSPPNFEHLRERLEPVLTPLPNPREAQVVR